MNFIDNTIKPDGGVFFLRKKDDENYKKVLLITDAKRQGANDTRKKKAKANKLLEML
ncbi:hypothetical protein [Campylobacter sp. 2018MI34]|uniref:hypothetical protein n=1 Tax=Campylobacter sp. 2018MI34 TaxID=2800582 RepID=UPI001FED3CC3|nr:hypothetical protein [Campylobacter sp. 2018MI34]